MDSVNVPVPVFTKVPAPPSSRICPEKVVEALLPPTVNTEAFSMVSVPAPAIEPTVSVAMTWRNPLLTTTAPASDNAAPPLSCRKPPLIVVPPV